MTTPTLPYAYEAFRYRALHGQRPIPSSSHVAVFTEVRRVLRPGGQFLVSFSNRCFPTKATQLWLGTDDDQHLALVRLYFEQSGGWEPVEAFDLSPHPSRSDPLFVVTGRTHPAARGGDPPATGG